VYKLTPAYRLRKAGHQCSGPESLITDRLIGVEDCAHECAEQAACKFFYTGTNQKTGECHYLTDAAGECTSYTVGDYDVHELMSLDGETGTSAARMEWAGVERWSSSSLSPRLAGWLTVAEEAVVSGNHVEFDNDRLHTLDLRDLPAYVESGDYDVMIEWADTEYIHFHVPAGSNIFSQAETEEFTVEIVNTSLSSSWFGSSGRFCHACVTDGGDKPGETCWAVTPVDDSSRECGCSSESGFSGSGVYMGGYKEANQCTGLGGGFAGPKASGAEKGGLDSVGFVMKIRSTATGDRSLLWL